MKKAEKKVVSFKITGPSGSYMISQNMADLLTVTFGCDEGGAISEETLDEENLLPDDDE